MGVSSSFEVRWKWKHRLKLPGTQPCRTSENHPSEVEVDRKTLGSRASQPFLYCESHHIHTGPGDRCGSHGEHREAKLGTILWKWHAGRSWQACSCPVSSLEAAGGWLAHAVLRAIISFLFSLPLVTFCIMRSQTSVQRSFSLPGSVSGMGSSLLHLVWKRAILTPSLPKMHIFLVTNTRMTPDPQDKQHSTHSFPRLECSVERKS